MSEVRIIVLNYNGEELLPQCLPSIVEAARRSRARTRVSVLDNGSRDRGLDYVRGHYPEVLIHLAPKNRILCSYNDCLPLIDEEVVILLNNDIRVDPDFVDPLIERFESDPETFLVAPLVMSFDGSRIECGPSRGEIRYGIFWASGRYPGYEEAAGRAGQTYASGFGAFSRAKFLELGGYDERYLPGILEDTDLCLRARRRGYRLWYEPRSVVYHMGQVSFDKEFGRSRREELAARNTFLFMWKNFSGLSFWLNHLFFLPLRLFRELLCGRFYWIKGFFQALGRGVGL